MPILTSVISPTTWPATSYSGMTISSLTTWNTTMIQDLFNPSYGLYYHNIATVTTSTVTTSTIMLPTIRSVSSPPGARPRSLPLPGIVVDPEASLARSLRLFRRLRPAAEVERFLAGKHVRLRGERFDYHVRKTMDFLEHTRYPHQAHIPYSLALVAKDGRTLARGCVTVPGTPVIDQLLALMFHVEDRDEEARLLARTNWTPHPPELLAAA